MSPALAARARRGASGWRTAGREDRAARARVGPMMPRSGANPHDNGRMLGLEFASRIARAPAGLARGVGPGPIARRAVSSAVEHYLDMVGVTGSNPVPPTKINSLGCSFWTNDPPSGGFCVSGAAVLSPRYVARFPVLRYRRRRRQEGWRRACERPVQRRPPARPASPGARLPGRRRDPPRAQDPGLCPKPPVGAPCHAARRCAGRGAGRPRPPRARCARSERTMQAGGSSRRAVEAMQ